MVHGRQYEIGGVLQVESLYGVRRMIVSCYLVSNSFNDFITEQSSVNSLTMAIPIHWELFYNTVVGLGGLHIRNMETLALLCPMFVLSYEQMSVN